MDTLFSKGYLLKYSRTFAEIWGSVISSTVSIALMVTVTGHGKEVTYPRNCKRSAVLQMCAGKRSVAETPSRLVSYSSPMRVSLIQLLTVRL